MALPTFTAGRRVRASELAALVTQLGTLDAQTPALSVRGGRATSGTATAAVEKTYLRVDNIPIVSGQAYRIWTTPMLINGTVAGDTIQAILRGSTSGAATTSSTQLTYANGVLKSASSLVQPSLSLQVLYVASTTGTLSVLLSYIRIGGTGNVFLDAAATLPAQINVDAYNDAAPSDTGVAL